MDIPDAVLRRIAESHPASAAYGLEGLDAAQAAKILEALPERVAAIVIERMTPLRAALVLARLDAARLAGVVREISPRAASGVLQHLNATVRDAALAGLPEDHARRVRELLRYPADTAGAIMDPQVASLPSDVTIQEAIELLRRTPREALTYLYVTDRDGRLFGIIGMRELLLAPPGDAISAHVVRDVLSVRATMQRSEVVALFEQRRFLALPVVNEEQRLIGVIRQEQVLQSARQEAFEKMQKMVGAGAQERAASPVSTAVRTRLPWLALKLATAFLAALVVGAFQGTIAQLTALAVLMPVVVAMAGNTGSQTLTIVMRGLALQEIGPRDARPVVVKEMAGALLNGLAIALLCGAVVLVWMRAPALALLTGGAIALNMAAGGLFGAVVPLALRKLGRDPAQSSVIFLTTVTDVAALGSFLGLAALLGPALT